MLIKTQYVTKQRALTDIFAHENIREKWTSKKVIVDLLLQVLSKKTYALEDELPLSSAGITKLLKKLWPEKYSSGNKQKICQYVLGTYQLKTCSCCGYVLNFNCFNKQLKEQDGLHSMCKSCYSEYSQEYKREYQAEYRARVLQRTPTWADKLKIREYYNECPEGYQVDHIVPLQGKLVSGLHVHNNLQYLLPEDNRIKSNTFII